MKSTSNELAFKMAGIFALKEAAKKANAILLEPVMKVEVTTPDEYQGDLLGDLNRRRGKIVHIEAKEGSTIVSAEVPLAEMFGYATAIRSLSKGRPVVTVTPEPDKSQANDAYCTELSLDGLGVQEGDAKDGYDMKCW